MMGTSYQGAFKWCEKDQKYEPCHIRYEFGKITGIITNKGTELPKIIMLERELEGEDEGTG